MTDLARYNNHQLLALPKEQQRYVALHNGAGISKIDEDRLYQSCVKAIASAHVRSKQTGIEDKDINTMANILSTDAAKLFPNITIMELNEAFHNGVLGVYGEFFGLNNVTFIGWIRSFVNEEKRLEALSVAAKLKEPKPEPNEAEKKAIAEESIRTMVEHYGKTGEILNHGNANFHYLWNTGQIKFGKEQAVNYIEQAEQKLLSTLEAEKQIAKDSLNSLAVKALIKQIEGITKTSEVVRIEAGKLAIIEWIKKQPKWKK